VVLLSPACSSFDMFQNYQHRGELFRQAVQHLVQTISDNVSGPAAAAIGRDTLAAGPAHMTPEA